MATGRFISDPQRISRTRLKRVSGKVDNMRNQFRSECKITVNPIKSVSQFGWKLTSAMQVQAVVSKKTELCDEDELMKAKWEIDFVFHPGADRQI